MFWPTPTTPQTRKSALLELVVLWPTPTPQAAEMEKYGTKAESRCELHEFKEIMSQMGFQY